MKRNEVQTNNVKNVLISTTTILGNSPVLSSKYLLLKSLFINTSEGQRKSIMKELMCVVEDNEIEMNIVCWGGRGKKIINIPFSGHLRYTLFKQNFKCNNFIHLMLEVLFDNGEGNMSSSLINVCHYFAECYEGIRISCR